MAKTGYKYTKQAPAKGNRNMLPKSNASSKLNRTAPKGDTHLRSAQTIARLKMYNNGKAVRNKEGKIVGGQFMMADRAGDRKITSVTGWIAPDRRWFGNTRVVAPTELDRFREELTQSMADPYSVVIKRKQLPMGLFKDAAEIQAKEGRNNSRGLLINEPFEQTFGKKSLRKRVKVEQYMVGRTSKMDSDCNEEEEQQLMNGGKAEAVALVPDDDDVNAYASILSAAQKSQETYVKVNNRIGMVPHGRDVNLTKTSGEGIDWKKEKKDDLFLKGQSKRIWGEFYKVVDCSDVVLHIIDARNVPGTRCTMIEKHITKNAPHKHLVFVLNKIDLVPNWVAKRWIGELAQIRPTIAFHASITHAFGKGALISLLRQFGKLACDKKQISVGVIGYPNVGKSSVINTLISKKSCKVAPVPGETKIWQYITLFRNIYLIDCPGVVVDAAGDSETDSVLKGVVRAERLENPEEFIDAIQEAVKKEHIAALYGLENSGENTWKSSEELLEKISLKCGRLRKGGEPCLRSSAIMLINDFQRGRLPHYVSPPELKEGDLHENRNRAATSIAGIKAENQNLDEIEVRREVEDARGSSVTNKGQEQSESNEGDSEESCSENEANVPVSLASDERGMSI